uniref:transketolase n=1 Tax=Chromera velia CCMP2878 TaxID=1169474 RepID=A0A0G4GLZ4_9ALVE|eukprot:Cvel_4889.t1-p1 / transcript=Cvel_4889.t1 / gene=Cvel_4889 / organism=Chromera_velia_CCMP2878 / gene_product=Transketolase-1, chloroplastic, putative / transcript_product=Transketolase-1, chloroplastic, putative / location=Cvel_scaffold220:81236-89887(-) / protein_length=903 / sequence_SO=supercontig / SO=protein_coding / is_pseudo=false
MHNCARGSSRRKDRFAAHRCRARRQSTVLLRLWSWNRFDSSFEGTLLTRLRHTMAPKRKAAAASAASADSKKTRTSTRDGREVDKRSINTIRVLGAEQPSAAKSGHPGAPMGCAPMAHALFGYQMNYCGEKPDWPNRDRFVLSNGHGCALLYTMLHLGGFDVSLDDLKNFRQIGSKTPGHPESFCTPGVEVITGPLGQGISSAVGLAVGAHHMAATYNKKKFDLFDSFVYCIVGDGCLMEGVASEACSLAGRLELGRLICLYDSNDISIDGSTDLSFSEDVAMRFKSYGWHVLEVSDGDGSHIKILEAVEKAQKHKEAPSLVIVRTTIGFGSKLAGTEKVHGAPLATDDLAAVKTAFGFDPEKSFQIPKDVKEFYKEKRESNRRAYQSWLTLFEKYAAAYPEEAKEIKRRFEGTLPEGVLSSLPEWAPDAKAEGTRNSSGKCLNAVAKVLPELIGGSADLTGSNCTKIEGWSDFDFKTMEQKYLRFGVREHAMAAICNGLFNFGGFRPFAATFLNFVTYAWGAVRLSALGRCGILYIATHDSIELGEDGPTHQPIETLALCRATPNMLTMRPGDGPETAGCYKLWLQNRTRPSVMALCRSGVPRLPGTCAEGTEKGGYVIADWPASGSAVPKVVIGSCGSELHIAAAAREVLMKMEPLAVNVRLVSIPCFEVFGEQSQEYIESVFGGKRGGVKRIFIEATSDNGVYKFFDDFIGMSSFGQSAPRGDCWKYFGFTKTKIANKILSSLGLSNQLPVPEDENMKMHGEHHEITTHPVATITALPPAREDEEEEAEPEAPKPPIPVPAVSIGMAPGTRAVAGAAGGPPSGPPSPAPPVAPPAEATASSSAPAEQPPPPPPQPEANGPVVPPSAPVPAPPPADAGDADVEMGVVEDAAPVPPPPPPAE